MNDFIVQQGYYDIPEAAMHELINLWHLSRVVTNDRYQRRLWTCREFNKQFPEHARVSYKNLDRQLAQ